MAVSDDKQNRLSGLSQDVIAVTRKTPPDSRALPASRASVQGAAPPTPVAPRLPTNAKPVAASTTASPGAALRGAAWGAVMVSVAALLMATYAVRSAGGLPAANGQADALVRLDADLKAVTARMALLETAARSPAADGGAEKGAAARSTTNPQLSTALRIVRNDLDKLTAELAVLTTQGSVQNSELRALAGSASKDGKMALTRVDQLSAQLATFTEQVRGMQRSGAAGGGPVAASGDTQAQLQILSRKTDMMAADIRQLYRQIESQRP